MPTLALIPKRKKSPTSLDSTGCVSLNVFGVSRLGLLASFHRPVASGAPSHMPMLLGMSTFIRQETLQSPTIIQAGAPESLRASSLFQHHIHSRSLPACLSVWLVDVWKRIEVKIKSAFCVWVSLCWHCVLKTRARELNYINKRESFSQIFPRH